MNTPDTGTGVDRDATVNLSGSSFAVPTAELPPGRYEILEYVTSGGSGAIFKGRHILLDKLVAIKMLNHESAEHLMRFQQEAKALAKLSHPNIIQVLELGTNTKGEPYLVMDWFDGCSLKEHLAGLGAVPISEAIPLLVKVAKAIGAAHRQGILHRDIKPGNIMVLRNRDGSLEAKLVDFGIAKDIGDKTSSTQSGAAIGTPLYMSPEQGGGKKISKRSDLYSFGCVMFEVLTGHPPFEAESSVEILQKHRSEEPPRLRAKNKKAAVPPHIEELVYKLLSKNPDERPESAEEVVARLESTGDESPSKKKLSGKTVLIRMSIAIAMLIVAAMLYQISSLDGGSTEANKILNKKTSLSKPKRYVPETLAKLTDMAARKTRNKTAEASATQKKVNWSQLTLNDANLEAEVGAHWQTEELLLFGNPITDRGLKALAILPLRDLDISFTAVSGSGLASFQKPEVLSRLNIGNCFVTNEALKALAHFRNLEDLSINDNKNVTDLSTVAKLPNLRKLSVAGTRIDYNGLLPLANCKRLEHLKLSGVKLTPAMVKVVTKLKNLTILEIRGTGIDDHSIEEIATNLPNLVALNIGSNPITKKALIILGECSRLQEVYVAGCKRLTEQDIASFMATHQGCKLITKTTVVEGDFNVPFVKSLLDDFRTPDTETNSKQKSKIEF